MALCSYDNELNTKYNLHKGFNMARKVADANTQKTQAVEAGQPNMAAKKAMSDAAKKAAEEVKKEAQENAAAKKAAEEAAKKAAQTKIEKTQEDCQGEDSADLNIIEALELAERGKVVARRGWAKELNSSGIIIKRGHTLPSLKTGKYESSYTPSITDVVTKDWYEKA